jgi:hypothetical protein
VPPPKTARVAFVAAAPLSVEIAVPVLAVPTAATMLVVAVVAIPAPARRATMLSAAFRPLFSLLISRMDLQNAEQENPVLLSFAKRSEPLLRPTQEKQLEKLKSQNYLKKKQSGKQH